MLDTLVFSRMLSSRSFGNFRDFVRQKNGSPCDFAGKENARVRRRCYSRNIGRQLRGRLSSTKTLLVNLQSLDFGIEGRLRDPELGCSSAWARNPAIRLREGRLDHLSLLGDKLLGKRLNRRIGACRLSGEPTFVDGKIFRIGDDHRSLDDVL